MRSFVKPKSRLSWYDHKERGIFFVSKPSRRKRRRMRVIRKHAKKAYRQYLKIRNNYEYYLWTSRHDLGEQ